MGWVEEALTTFILGGEEETVLDLFNGCPRYLARMGSRYIDDNNFEFALELVDVLFHSIMDVSDPSSDEDAGSSVEESDDVSCQY